MSAAIVRRPDGGIELHDWPGWAVRVLDEMAVLAGPEIPGDRARARLFPDPTDDLARDAAAHEEWRRHVHPDLFALLASAQEIVARDLAAARRDDEGGIGEMAIPKEHIPGWIAAINAARLHLGAAHGVDADAMQVPFDQLDEERRPAVVRIDMLGELQYHLIRTVEPLGEADPDVEEPGGGGDGDDGPPPPRAPRKRAAKRAKPRTAPPRKPRRRPKDGD